MPVMLRLKIKGLRERKICVVSQLTTRYKALVNLLQYTNCANADQLGDTTPFTLVGLISSRKHGLAALVHEKPTWALTDRSLEG